jgi:hypothetical protein
MLLLLHAPPAVALLSVLVLPSHITAVPPMAAGIAFTVMVRIAAQPAGIT